MPLIQSNDSVLWRTISLEKKHISFFEIFLHRNNHQVKAASEGTIFCRMWRGEPLLQSDYTIHWPKISLGRTKLYLWFCAWRQSLGEDGMWGKKCLWSNEIPGFFDYQYLGREPIDIFVSPLLFFFFFLLSPCIFINLHGGPFNYEMFKCFFLSNGIVNLGVHNL